MTGAARGERRQPFIDKPSVRRLMRALAFLGVFAATGEDRYGLTPISEYLRTDHPESFQRTAAQLTDHWGWRAWGDLLHSVRTGETAFTHVFGSSFFDYL